MMYALELAYFASAILFIIGLKLLGSPATAKRGNSLSAVGMALAILATSFHPNTSYYIFVAILIGAFLGSYLANTVKMIAMPEMVALLNGLGGLSSLLVGWSFYHQDPYIDPWTAFSVCLSIIVGGITFSGSVIAWLKLRGSLSAKPLLFPMQKFFSTLLLLTLTFSTITASLFFPFYSLYVSLIVSSLLLGVFFVMPIGGADMPVVISLLNSYSGLAAAASGFIIQNHLLIIAGTLVGASGIILTSIMCKAMNRSLAHVLFSGLQKKQSLESMLEKKETKTMTAKDTYYLLESARSILIVPGYGLAVAQAQHALKELSALFEENGAEVRYAIHPVAGRMPGHMNVLLAEAGISYDDLVEMEAINPIMDTVDVCIVIGANDVVNPSAKEDKNSPIYGMPVIETHLAKNVLVLKRSMNSGFSGIENPLFYKKNTAMVFGDAKTTIQEMVGELKNS